LLLWKSGWQNDLLLISEPLEDIPEILPAHFEVQEIVQKL